MKLVIVGGGPLWKNIRKQSLNLPIEMVGYVADRKKVASYLAAADVVIAPGPLETFCLSALESLASGTPVVASASSAVGEILNLSCPQPAGAVAADDGQSFANAIANVLRDSSRRKSARTQAEQFDWCNTVSKMLQLHGSKEITGDGSERLAAA